MTHLTRLEQVLASSQLKPGQLPVKLPSSSWLLAEFIVGDAIAVAFVQCRVFRRVLLLTS